MCIFNLFLHTTTFREQKIASTSELIMTPIEFMEPGILNLLRQMDVKKSPGPDNISNTILRCNAKQVTPFIHKIFTASLQTSTLPTDWLRAKVFPIHKGGSKLCVNTYRHISLTSCCCKHMERIINKAIMAYLEENNLMCSKWHGFCKGVSTVMQLLEIIHDFATVINFRLQADTIFIDFSKVFDRAVHCKLINKLRAIGIECDIMNKRIPF